MMSTLIKDTVGDDDRDEDDDATPAPSIPLPNVSSDVLHKVISFCDHHQTEPMTAITTPLRSNVLKDLVQEWYNNFVDVEKEMLFALVAAANYLDIKELLDLTCLAVSILIKGKSAKELREMFNIEAELTEEERAQIQQENNQWAAENNAENAAPPGESNDNDAS